MVVMLGQYATIAGAVHDLRLAPLLLAAAAQGRRERQAQWSQRDGSPGNTLRLPDGRATRVAGREP